MVLESAGAPTLVDSHEIFFTPDQITLFRIFDVKGDQLILVSNRGEAYKFDVRSNQLSGPILIYTPDDPLLATLEAPPQITPAPTITRMPEPGVSFNSVTTIPIKEPLYRIVPGYQMSTEAFSYLDEALDIIQKNHYKRSEIDWKHIRDTAYLAARYSKENFPSLGKCSDTPMLILFHQNSICFSQINGVSYVIGGFQLLE